MKDLKDLNTFERTVLYHFCKITNYSLKARVPIEAITRCVERGNQQYVKKAVNTLRTNGFVRKQPSGRKMTYKISKYTLKISNFIGLFIFYNKIILYKIFCIGKFLNNINVIYDIGIRDFKKLIFFI